MNPEMMRQMLERLAAARVNDPANGDGRNPRMPYDPSNGEGGRFLRRGNSNTADMPFVEGDSNAVDMPQRGISESRVRPGQARELEGNEMRSPLRMQGMGEQDEQASILGFLLDIFRNMPGEYDGPVRPNPADAPARDPQGRRLTPMGKVGPTETESAGKDAAMLNRAREMARMAAMQRILRSEDIPPSPTR